MHENISEILKDFKIAKLNFEIKAELKAASNTASNLDGKNIDKNIDFNYYIEKAYSVIIKSDLKWHSVDRYSNGVLYFYQ